MLFLLVLQHQLIDLKYYEYYEYNYTSSRSVCKLSTSTFVSSTFFSFFPFQFQALTYDLYNKKYETKERNAGTRNNILFGITMGKPRSAGPSSMIGSNLGNPGEHFWGVMRRAGATSPQFWMLLISFTILFSNVK